MAYFLVEYLFGVVMSLVVGFIVGAALIVVAKTSEKQTIPRGRIVMLIILATSLIVGNVAYLSQYLVFYMAFKFSIISDLMLMFE